MKLYPAAKHMIGTVVASLPQSIAEPFLKIAALAPPVLKTQSFARLCARVSQAPIYHDCLIETNFGIVPRFRCRIPVQKSQYAFGRPANHLAERGTLCLVRELAKDCQHFLDVGAHEGIYTFVVAAERRENIDLHWFEPEPTLSVRLSGNLERNRIRSYGNSVAASDKIGQTTFYQNLTDDASGSLVTYFGDRHALRPITVEAVRLSDYFVSKGITGAIVKVDVEGAGLQIWSGLEQCCRDMKYLVMEMLASEMQNQLPSRIIEHTGWHGYYLRDFELIESKNGEFEYIEPFWNWLFCDLDPIVLRERLLGTKFRITAA
jgi:FkbM family methyltransferase